MIGFDGDDVAGLGEFADDGEEAAVLAGFIDAFGLGERRLGADVEDGGSLGGEDMPACDGGVGGETDAFAIPGICGQIDDPHQFGTGIAVEAVSGDFKGGDAGGEGVAMLVCERCEIFKLKHGGECAVPEMRQSVFEKTFAGVAKAGDPAWWAAAGSLRFEDGKRMESMAGWHGMGCVGLRCVVGGPSAG